MFRLVHGLSRILGILGIAILIFMMVSTVADVVARIFYGAPIAGVTEMGELLMVGSVFLGLAYAESQKAHVSVTLLSSRISHDKAALLNAIGLAVVIVILCWMVVVTGQRAWISFTKQEYRFGLIKIFVWPGRLAIVLGLLGYTLEAALRFYTDLRGLAKHDAGGSAA